MFSELIVTPVVGVAGKWELYAPFTWESEVDGFRVDVAKGRVTDLASIPRLFRGIFQVNGKHRRAAVVHDELYKTGAVPRKDADLRFLEAMEEAGVGWLKRRMMYRAVRLGGWAAYQKRES